MMPNKLWTRNFSLAILASGLGAAGAIAGGFALSFLVFDETGSTLASALVIAVQLAPYVLVPLLVAPLMDSLGDRAEATRLQVGDEIIVGGIGLFDGKVVR